MEEVGIDHDGDGRTCPDQQGLADQVDKQLEGLGMAPIGSGILGFFCFLCFLRYVPVLFNGVLCAYHECPGLKQ
jgi:hypothetical protein